jgi:hypothetical protein
VKKTYLLTADEFAQLERIQIGAARVAGEMRALFARDPFPKADEIAHAYGVGLASISLSADDLARVMKQTTIIMGEDVGDGLTECNGGPHLFDPDKLPDWATDRERCSECQPSKGEVEA